MDRARLTLVTTDHDCDVAGLKYVYAVRSRRVGGISIGVNLNPNNACNWRCVYCQVPGLVSGKGPRIDLDLLESELEDLLGRGARGELVEQSRQTDSVLKDIAFSGDGEPTSSPDFAGAVERVERVLARSKLGLDVILITNGSMLGKASVQAAVGRLGALESAQGKRLGQVWFKLDRATQAGMLAVNSTRLSPASHLERLRVCAALCPTWVQSCFFMRRGELPREDEVSAYVAALEGLVRANVPLRGVLLYTLARPSEQREAPELRAVDIAWLEALAQRVRTIGIAEVRVAGP